MFLHNPSPPPTRPLLPYYPKGNFCSDIRRLLSDGYYSGYFGANKNEKTREQFTGKYSDTDLN